MDITRINAYDDPRFSTEALRQHGCYLVDDKPCEVLITAEDSARIACTDRAALPTLIEEFRFHAPHITRFVDEQGTLVQAFPPRELLTIPLTDIQPSQFYVDEEKLAAVRSFIRQPEDIIIQVLPHAGRYIALDGHTRLYLAAMEGWPHVRAVAEETDAYILDFVAEAQKRGIDTPADMALIPHAEYEIRWNRFCDDYFSQQQ